MNGVSIYTKVCAEIFHSNSSGEIKVYALIIFYKFCNMIEMVIVINQLSNMK